MKKENIYNKVKQQITGQMKARKQFLSILFHLSFIICLAAACSDDDKAGEILPGDDTPATNDGLITVRFASGADGESTADAAPGTRTTIGNDGETVSWTLYDEIGITAVPATADGTTVNNKQYKPAKAAANSTFTATDGEMQLAADSYAFRSYYPYQSGSNVTADKVSSFELSEMTQTDGTRSDHIGPKDLMWATAETTISEGDDAPQVSFAYKHVFPMLVFKLENTNGKQVKCISVRSANQKTAVQGTVSLNLTDGNWDLVGEGFYYTSLTFSTPMDAAGTGRLLILPQAAGTQLIVGVMTTKNVIYEYTKTAPEGGLQGGNSYTFTFDLNEGTVENRSVYTGDGKNTKWQIGSASCLRAFALAINYYGLPQNTDASLTANVELDNNGKWEDPIGRDGTLTYQGTFDGQGHTVSNLNATRSVDYAGLFGYLADGKVRNLRVGGSVTAETSMYVGGIAGKAEGSSVIENCLFAGGTVKGKSSVGGIVGGNFSTITGCYASGNAEATEGGVGGIAGTNSGATIAHCYSSMAVTTSDSYAGGIVGSNSYYTTLYTCYATGNVSATAYAGGIAGNNDGTLSNCIALGAKVIRTGTDSDTHFGRVAGYSNSKTTKDCAAYTGMTVRDGATIADNDANASASGIHGAPLTAEQCLTTKTYTDRGFANDATEATATTPACPGWSFDSNSSWTHLPWTTPLWSAQSPNDNTARISIPDHLKNR